MGLCWDREIVEAHAREMMAKEELTVFRLAAVLLWAALPGLCAKWEPAPSTLTTPWTAKVRPSNVLPEYPRPQMVRKQWTNLNGLWNYAIEPKDAAQPKTFRDSILVPFAIESSLSGVKKPLMPEQRLWYRRTFRAPKMSMGLAAALRSC